MLIVFDVDELFILNIVMFPAADGSPLSLENTIWLDPPVNEVEIDSPTGKLGDMLFASDELYVDPLKNVYEVEEKYTPKLEPFFPAIDCAFASSNLKAISLAVVSTNFEFLYEEELTKTIVVSMPIIAIATIISIIVKPLKYWRM
jgi:hypothetical protein